MMILLNTWNKDLSDRRESARQLCIHVYLVWLTDRAMQRTLQNHGCHMTRPSSSLVVSTVSAKKVSDTRSY